MQDRYKHVEPGLWPGSATVTFINMVEFTNIS